METQKRAWIYTRIDAPEDNNGALKKQEKELMEYAGRLGYDVVGSSSDIGGVMACGLPGITEMTAAADSGEFDVLLVKNVSRLGHEATPLFTMLTMFENCGIEVLSPLHGRVDTGLPTRYFSDEEKVMEEYRNA